MTTTTPTTGTTDTREALQRITGIASEQNGYITRAQATNLGVHDVALNRLARRGVIEHIDHGIYRLPGAPNTGLDQLYATWLRFDPAADPAERLAHPKVVVVGGTAAWVWGLGDLQEYPYELVVPRPYRTHRSYPELILTLDPELKLANSPDVTINNGIAVTIPDRTIADLLIAGHDGDHVGRVLRDAITQGRSTLKTIGARLDQLITSGLLDKPDRIRNGRAWAEHLASLAT